MTRSLSDSGLLYLLRSKDEYGVWYSTQATVDVLDAIVNAANHGGKTEGVTAEAQQRRRKPAAADPRANVLTVIANGKEAGKVEISAKDVYSNAITFDLSALETTGSNEIEIRSSGEGMRATAELVSSYYRPWGVTAQPGVETDADRALALRVTFDKTNAKVGDEVTCTVRLERIGSRSQGMLVAEVALPPGADVDRASLTRAVEGPNWSLDRYEVLPDRLLVYLWPRAGGASFQFKFRPTFAMNAKTPASILYDYYNPEARAVIPPVTFVVRADEGKQ